MTVTEVDLHVDDWAIILTPSPPPRESCACFVPRGGLRPTRVACWGGEAAGHDVCCMPDDDGESLHVRRQYSQTRNALAAIRPEVR